MSTTRITFMRWPRDCRVQAPVAYHPRAAHHRHRHRCRRRRPDLDDHRLSDLRIGVHADARPGLRPRRPSRTYLLALAAVAICSVLAAFAPDLTVMLLARVVQGLGGAVSPLWFGLVRDAFPPSRVAGAIGELSAIMAAGSGVGMVTAGPVSALIGWRGLFSSRSARRDRPRGRPPRPDRRPPPPGAATCSGRRSSRDGWSPCSCRSAPASMGLGITTCSACSRSRSRSSRLWLHRGAFPQPADRHERHAAARGVDHQPHRAALRRGHVRVWAYRRGSWRRPPAAGTASARRVTAGLIMLPMLVTMSSVGFLGGRSAAWCRSPRYSRSGRSALGARCRSRCSTVTRCSSWPP